jgi:hypothetical protein
MKRNSQWKMIVPICRPVMLSLLMKPNPNIFQETKFQLLTSLGLRFHSVPDAERLLLQRSGVNWNLGREDARARDFRARTAKRRVLSVESKKAVTALVKGLTETPWKIPIDIRPDQDSGCFFCLP